MKPPPRVLWSPTEEDRASANVTRFLDWLESERGLTFGDYAALWRWSVDELDVFWDAVRCFFDIGFPTEESSVLEGSMPGARWFEGASCNYAEEVLAGARLHTGEHPALIAVAEEQAPVEMSWDTLRGKVGALASELRELGVERGDRVAAYLPNIPEAVISLLAVSSLGAVWSSCAPDFGARSVIDRLGQISPKVLIAVDGYRFAGRAHDRRGVVAELQAAIPSLRATILVQLLGSDHGPPDGLDVRLFEEITREPKEPIFEQVPFEHPLWILFSSGTTGLPKGIVQGHGGIILEHLKALGLCLDLHQDDRFLFFSSTSWMAWNYLVGGLLHGCTIVLYNGSPGYPQIDELWRVAKHTDATVLGMGSAYASGCEKAGVELGGPGHLRLVIPTGSPLPPSGWEWLHEQLGRVRIDSILGGTDVCTAFFGGSPLLPVWLGEISCRWLGVHAEAYDEEGHQLTDSVGEFVLVKPMPSMPVEFWADPTGARYRDSYFDFFPGVWRQGDWITITSRGSVIASGRSDATLNRGGVRLGSAEIYAIVERMPEVTDSLVVGVELADGGYYMPLFVVAAPDTAVNEEVRARMVAQLRTELSPRHVPDEIVEVPAIPRTLTGKKLEVPIKRILQGVSPEHATAMGAIDKPDAVEWFSTFARDRVAATTPAREP